MKNKKFNVGDIIHAYYYKNGELIYHKSEVVEKGIYRNGIVVKTRNYIKYLDNGRAQLAYCPNIDEIGVVTTGPYLRLYLTNKDDELAYEKFEKYYIDNMNKVIEETKSKLEQLRKSKKRV